MDHQAHLVTMTIGLKYGSFSDDERKALVEAFRNSQLGQVRIDEAIVTNLGIGGPGGLPISFDIWLNMIEGAVGGTAAGLLTIAITSGIKPVLKVAGRNLMRLMAVIHKDETEPVTYIADPEAVDQALEAMSVDYEEVISTEFRLRIWRDGRWQREETMTRRVKGSN
jgi:hypothetical protein